MKQRILDGILYAASLPFLVIGLTVGLCVTITLWIVASVLAGYSAGRGR